MSFRLFKIQPISNLNPSPSSFSTKYTLEKLFFEKIIIKIEILAKLYFLK